MRQILKEYYLLISVFSCVILVSKFVLDTALSLFALLLLWLSFVSLFPSLVCSKVLLDPHTDECSFASNFMTGCLVKQGLSQGALHGHLKRKISARDLRLSL